MGKKRIVHIVPTFLQGGVQTGILYSLAALNKIYDYKVLVLTEIDAEWIKNLSEEERKQIITTGAAGMVSSWIKGYKILRELNPDFIISSMWKSSGLSIPYKIFDKKAGLAGFFHTSYSPHMPYRISMKLLTYFQDLCLADSNVTKDYATSVYKTTNTHVIPYLFPFEQKTRPREFDPKKISLSYFGILSPVKRVDRALEFCKICKAHGLNFIFDMYAHGAVDEYNQKIREMGLAENVFIKMTLPLNQVIDRMQQYDFLLQLSDHEGMALSVVEAMNCGVVPIVTPVGEIANYSVDGMNALWLNKPFDQNLEKLFEKFMIIVNDRSAYNKLSSSATVSFDDYRKYSESLLEVLATYFEGEK